MKRCISACYFALLAANAIVTCVAIGRPRVELALEYSMLALFVATMAFLVLGVLGLVEPREPTMWIAAGVAFSLVAAVLATFWRFGLDGAPMGPYLSLAALHTVLAVAGCVALARTRNSGIAQGGPGRRTSG